MMTLKVKTSLEDSRKFLMFILKRLKYISKLDHLFSGSSLKAKKEKLKG
jgi:hypothetical protein